MDGWMDKKKKKILMEKIDGGWMDGQKKYMKKMDGWMDTTYGKKQMDGLDEKIYEKIWMVGWIKKQMDGWMDKKIRKKYGWLDG